MIKHGPFYVGVAAAEVFLTRAQATGWQKPIWRPMCNSYIHPLLLPGSRAILDLSYRSRLRNSNYAMSQQSIPTISMIGGHARIRQQSRSPISMRCQQFRGKIKYSGWFLK